MKKLLILAALLTSTSAFADGHHGGGGSFGGFMGPALIGGIIGYEIGQPRVVQQPQVIYQPVPAPVVVQQPPQVIYLPTPPAGFHYESFYDQKCNCYRTALFIN